MEDKEELDRGGWDRVKNLLQLSETNHLSEELQDIPTIVCVGSLFGFLLGGQYGVRINTDRYLRHNKLTVYKSKMHAHRQFQSVKTIGFVRYGCRWGWRLGWFAGLYSFILAVTTAYRSKDDALNYVAAGASTGAIYKMFGGWRSMTVATVLCAGISLPVGLLSQLGNTYLIPEEYKQKKLEEKARMQDEWKQKLNATDSFIKSMEEDLTTVTDQQET